MKHVVDYVLVGFGFRNGRIILKCSKFSRIYPFFGFLSIEEPYSFSEEEFNQLFNTSYENFEEIFERDYFLRLIRISNGKLVLGEHISLAYEQYVCTVCKNAKNKTEMIIYRSMDHSGVCRDCSKKKDARYDGK